uniref:F5/8 type C domain-containing protein n=1 Tax=Hirudo nipponia TaxID=42736 RepID=A0AAF0Z4H4_HIRNI|nr:hypothetical protein [Hirudo nipponia]
MRLIISLLFLWCLCSASRAFNEIPLSKKHVRQGEVTRKGHDATLAIDGDLSTFSLAEGKETWWMIDLLKTYQISQVIITASHDAENAKYLQSFSIWLEDEKSNRDLCYEYTSTESLVPSETRSFPCKAHNFQTRFVKINTDGTNEQNKLVLAEVTIIWGLPMSQIFCSGDEITLIDETHNENANKQKKNLAIDKNVATFSLAESSDINSFAWLQVDLGELYDVGEVILTADDKYYNQSLQNFAIRLHGEHNSVQNCKDYKSGKNLAPRETRPFRCEGASFQTRFVRIERIGGFKQNLLAIAEVKVKTRSSPVTIFPNSEFGIEIPLAGNLVTLMGAEERDHVGNLATDGNVNSFAVVKTESSTGLWWQVDLEGNYHVGEVILTASIKQEYANCLHNFTIWLVNEKLERHFCNHYKLSEYFRKQETRSFVCEKDMFVARYIRIEKHGDSRPDTLALAEVAAFSGFSRRIVL